MRPAIAILLLVPALAFGQAKDDKPDKVSNDDPARPLQMPPASTETKEALDDFERFQRRGAGSGPSRRSTRSPTTRRTGSSTARTASSSRSRGRRRSILAALPPAGQAACRLFYDAEAKKLLDEAEGALRAEEPRADLLGLLHHLGRRQRGRPAGRPVLRARAVRPRGRLLAGGAARAARHRPLARPAGGEGRRGTGARGASRSEFEQVRAELADRYRDDKVTVAGRTEPAAEAPPPARRGRRRRRGHGRIGRRAPDLPGPDLAREVDAGLAVPHRRLDRGRHDAARAQPVAIQRPEHRRAGRGGRGPEPLRQLPGPHPGAGPGERQAALAHRVVPQPRAAGHAADRARCSTPAGSRSWPRASTSGRWAATSRTRTSWPRSS